MSAIDILVKSDKDTKTEDEHKIGIIVYCFESSITKNYCLCNGKKYYCVYTYDSIYHKIVQTAYKNYKELKEKSESDNPFTSENVTDCSIFFSKDFDSMIVSLNKKSKEPYEYQTY